MGVDQSTGVQNRLPAMQKLTCVVIVLTMCTVSGGRVWRAGACGIAQHGYCIPDAPTGNPGKMIQINHAIVDEKRLRYTGNVPLD